ncbi:MAG: TIGR03936 family radical SAM-associated protein [Candidatus Sabulitectum sp.]|nr:TIGR03936 family radical SAM-associated protein [Candidatus Sabulitectum sp.]
MFFDALKEVNRPQQYIGLEYNASPKRSGSRVTLVYPDTYELGASNFGLKVVRHLLLKAGEYSVRRGFHPAADMYRIMRERDLEWLDLEAGDPISESAVVGFGISTEILFTNVLSLLDLMKLELRSENRCDGDPIILAGGGGLANPVPLMPFVDVFFLGEAEAGLLPLMEILCSSLNRKEKLLKAADLRSVLVPMYHDGETVRWAIAGRMEIEDAPVKQIVPMATVAHDRAVVEISRGCTRGCRFCQASHLSRPVRERSPEDVLELIRKSVNCTGWEQAGVLTLSFSDYSRLNELLDGFSAAEEEMHLRISQPSLRPDTLPGLSSRRFFKGSLTMAPEAGSERMRKIINKPLSNDEILQAAETASRMGARGIKLYFMVGLPGETDEDIHAIATLADSIAKIMGKKRKVTAAISPFVPKPHTPFQWVTRPGHEELWRRIQLVRSNCRRARVSWNDPKVSAVEYLLCTGGKDSQNILERAYREGAVFDGWSDLFRWDVWEKFAGEARHANFHVGNPLPWDFVDTGISREWLIREYARSLKGETLPDCRAAGCSGCGACDGNVPPFPELIISSSEVKGCPAGNLPLERVRLRYSKNGLSRFTSHLDMVRMWTRVLRRSGLPVYYSSGFARRMKLVFSQPIPLGMSSDSEYLDFQLMESVNLDRVLRSLSQALPAGFRITALKKISGKYKSPGFLTAAAEYIIDGIDSTDKLVDYLRGKKLVLSISVVGKNKVCVISDPQKGASRPDRVMDAAGVRWRSIVRSNIYAKDQAGRLVPLIAVAEGEIVNEG